MYPQIEPTRIGYQKRKHKIKAEKDMFLLNEQRLLDQKGLIVKRQWLSQLELE